MTSAVITGSGIVGPSISNIEQFSHILRTGTCIVKPENYNGKMFYTGRITDEQLKERGMSKHPKPVNILLQAAEEAVAEAKATFQGARTAVIIGSSGGMLAEIEAYSRKTITKKRISSYAVGNMNTNSLSTSINAAFGMTGISFTISNSCTSGLDALYMAKMLIEANQADVCIAGGVDAVFSDTIVKGFTPLRSLQPFDPLLTYQGPFSAGRGFSMSEGAGVVVVERREYAEKRKARILGAIDAVSLSQDAVSPYSSDPAGEQLLKAVDECLRYGFPDYINSQALGLEENDRIEERIYRERFSASRIPITSIKGMIGHPMGASGMFQVISSLISMEKQFIPPVIHADPLLYKELPLNENVQYGKIERVLITTHGYGGNNSAALISKGVHPWNSHY
ncbi:hypothetical protein LRR81_07700 [Metabacillus sp. GX 13764]|uniref:beta-ketoacyl synthase N-terminal-like domain-containing protein n=1 Tax=Metabacillus kandeliae TaxID=2900151 RepID=UPI001E5E64A9|nr:beta-ketoacyl synthase N-terminal-like domain-containing protein [Metabacillus kandeliae]MCD7034114.1 hypothetical protein [Metabacillus kandeliae]